MAWSIHLFTSTVTDKLPVTSKLRHYFQFYPHVENHNAASIFQKYLGHSIYEILKIAL